jgi:hypothetical protein
VARENYAIRVQAELANRSGYIVIEAIRADKLSSGMSRVREFDIIEPYLKAHNINVVDLLASSTFVGDLRALSLPKDVRTIIGKKVKFVETGIRPTKIGWDLGKEVWLNVTNPTVRKIYERIRTQDLSAEDNFALSILIDLVDNEFDAVMQRCIGVLVGSDAEGTN